MNPADIHLSFYQAIGLVFTLIGGFASVILVFGKALLSSIDKRLDDKFAQIEKSRADDKEQWEKRYDKQVETTDKIESDLSQLNQELPRRYWQREDAIRETAIIHGKIDGIAGKIEALTFEVLKIITRNINGND